MRATSSASSTKSSRKACQVLVVMRASLSMSLSSSMTSSVRAVISRPQIVASVTVRFSGGSSVLRAPPTRTRSVGQVVPEAIHLMHPLVQDGHDADVAVRQPPPVHEMTLLPEIEAVDGELCWDRPRRDAVYLDFVECCKHIGDVTISLFSAPACSGRSRQAAAMQLPERGQPRCYPRFRAITSAAVNGR
jgi:hypothetical protein